VHALVRPAVAGLAACLVGSVVAVAPALAITTDRTIELLTAEWPTPGSAAPQGARISTDGTVVAFAAGPDIPGVAPGSSGQHVFIRDRSTSAIEQISVDSSETGHANNAWPGGISDDGRFVTFTGYQLVPYDVGEHFVYVRDRQLGTTELVSVADGGGDQNANCVDGDVDISADGRYVVFSCGASNLVPPGVDTGKVDVFLRDRQLGSTTRISVGPGGTQADGDSVGVAISDDGSTVVFESRATNLLGPGGDTNGAGDAFAYDVATGSLERVSVANDETEANGPVYESGLGVSADGSVVAFASIASNLIAPGGDTNGLNDVYVRDRAAGTTVRASVRDDGMSQLPDDGSWSPSLSADGTRVAFASRSRLSSGKTSSWTDVFLRDVAAGTTEMLSRNAAGLGGDNTSGDLVNVPAVAIDGSGDVVAFISYADDLTADPSDGGNPDVFVSAPTPADGDGDGISDDIDTTPGGGALTFSDGTTFGSVVTIPAGFSIAITDAVGTGEGVHILVTGTGTQKVQLSMCGGFTIRLPAGSDTVLTCGSIIVKVAPGSPAAEVVFDGGLAVITIPSGVTAEVGQTPGGGFTVGGVSGGSVSVTVDGSTTTVAPGGSLTGAAWDFDGFKAPVDNGGVPNQAKAGKAVPIKWHLAHADGTPVTNLASAQLTVASLTCPTGVTPDQVEEYTTGASGLTNDGNGNYHLNWQTPTSYANSCKTLRLDVGDGVLHTAVFKFTK